MPRADGRCHMCKEPADEQGSGGFCLKHRAENRERYFRSRREQGLPDHVEDSVVLDRLADLLRSRPDDV